MLKFFIKMCDMFNNVNVQLTFMAVGLYFFGYVEFEILRRVGFTPIKTCGDKYRNINKFNLSILFLFWIWFCLFILRDDMGGGIEICRLLVLLYIGSLILCFSFCLRGIISPFIWWITAIWISVFLSGTNLGSLLGLESLGLLAIGMGSWGRGGREGSGGFIILFLSSSLGTICLFVGVGGGLGSSCLLCLGLVLKGAIPPMGWWVGEAYSSMGEVQLLSYISTIGIPTTGLIIWAGWVCGLSVSLLGWVSGIMGGLGIISIIFWSGGSKSLGQSLALSSSINFGWLLLMWS